ncbi:hypothetical protein KP509_12G076800 [Ceratopteris richardii]|uniref:Uncharacterized protein n=1 Tax=Ceratopteris richardii TaxID=49495 RepID=A0A8T2TKC5_CERRI|nr:hypothetical protein KP509_12G076800 [Ceratopteris richardii]
MGSWRVPHDESHVIEFHVKRGCVQENGNVGDRHRLVTYLQKIWHPFIAISYSRKEILHQEMPRALSSRKAFSGVLDGNI